MEFYGAVQDQVVNMAPMGVEEGAPSPLYPRLEGWLAACEINGVPQHSRAFYVEMARTLFDAVQGRSNVSGLFQMPAEELAPPPLDDVDG